MSMTQSDERLMDEESDQLLVEPSQPKPRRVWPLLGVGLLGVAFGAASFLKPKRRYLSRQHLERLHDGLLRAFDSELMKERVEFNSSVDYLFAEVGAPEPSTMKLKSVIALGTEEYTGNPKLTVSFNAVEGKQAEAVKGIKDFLDGIVPSLEEDEGVNPDKLKFSEMYTVEAGDGDLASLVVTLPDDMKRQEKDIEKVSDELKKANPSLSVEMSYGRSFEDMIENSKDPMMLLPGGFQLKGDIGFAGTLFAALEDFTPDDPMPPYMEAVLGSITKVSSKEEVRYKKGAKLDTIPSIDDMIGAPLKAMIGQMFGSIPPPVVDALRALSENLDSIAGVSLTALPDSWECKATFTNMGIVKILKEGAKEKHGQKPPEWMNPETIADEMDKMEGSVEQLDSSKPDEGSDEGTAE